MQAQAQAVAWPTATYVSLGMRSWESSGDTSRVTAAVRLQQAA